MSNPTTIEDAREEGYEAGNKMAWLMILNEALRHLSQDMPDAAKLTSERTLTILALRTICRDFGDNDWPDELNLADVLNKHLLPYLEEAAS